MKTFFNELKIRCGGFVILRLSNTASKVFLQGGK
jgi:hypothetical protein